MRRYFLASLLFYCTSIFAQLSNLIVFGDSLSDGGNFPESTHVWWNPNGKKDMANTVPQLYVPFSNPVATKTDNPYLSAQAPIENQSTPRQYRSISWPQYFLMQAKSSNLIATDFIAPSNLLFSRKIPNTISFNYAWGYATSGPHCVNPYYQRIKQCNANSINQARKNYEQNRSQDNYNKLEIPGLIQQMHLFINDNRAQKVLVNQNTVYVFWSGGNDLIIASNALRKHHNPLPAFQFICGHTAFHQLKSIALLLHYLPIHQHPKIIYIFELFNPELTPGYYHTSLAATANFFVRCSNFWLHIECTLFNLFSSTKIVIVPTYQWYQHYAENNAFKSNMGKTCQLDGDIKNGCDGFMFWNAVHPSSKMNAITADLFLKWYR